MTEKTLGVPEVHCGHCVSSIEGAVGALLGVHEVHVDLDGKQVSVSFDEGTVELAAIIQSIEDQGYDVGESKPSISGGSQPLARRAQSQGELLHPPNPPLQIGRRPD
jgi:copper chaperone